MTFDVVFVGGGTPSIMPPELIYRLSTAIKKISHYLLIMNGHLNVKQKQLHQKEWLLWLKVEPTEGALVSKH